MKTYDTSQQSFDCGKYGLIEFLHWNHPRNQPITISEESIDRFYGFLKPGDMAIDIGAYTGDTAVPMAAAVGPTGLVLAYEPNPATFEVLRQNSRIHKNIHPIQSAVTRAPGRYTFRYSDEDFCNGGMYPEEKHVHELQVDGAPLRFNFVKNMQQDRPLRFIKIDAEGDDINILAHLRPIIDANRPIIRLEVYLNTSMEMRERLIRIVAQMNYEFEGRDFFQIADHLREIQGQVGDVVILPR